LLIVQRDSGSLEMEQALALANAGSVDMTVQDASVAPP